MSQYIRTNTQFSDYANTRDTIRARHNQLFELGNTGVAIYGCGAIGSYTAGTLARCCVGRLVLNDDDKVSAENIGVQDYTIPQLGKAKVYALEQNIQSINPSVYTMPSAHRVGDGAYVTQLPYDCRRNEINVHVIAVDNMEARAKIAKLIFEWASGFSSDYIGQRSEQEQKFLFIDARMGANTLQLHMLDCKYGLDGAVNRDYFNKYMDTWYSDEDGDREPCAARSTAYCSSFAGSIITSEIIKWVKNWELQTEELVFNFPNLMMEAKVANSDRSRGYTVSSKTFVQREKEIEEILEVTEVEPDS